MYLWIKRKMNRNTILEYVTNDILENYIRKNPLLTVDKLMSILGRDKEYIKLILNNEQFLDFSDLNNLIIKTDMPIALIVIKHLKKEKNIPQCYLDAYDALEKAIKKVI